jgi:VanZ family protein
MRLNRQIVWWLEAVAWMGLIFTFSGDSFASSRTLAVLHYCNGLFHLSLTEETLLLLNGITRKTAHFGIYFVLGLLVYRALAGRLARFTVRSACATLAVGLLYALADEYYQSLTQLRTASLYDSGLDFAGVVAAQIFILLRSISSPAPAPRTDLCVNPTPMNGANTTTQIQCLCQEIRSGKLPG